MMESINLKNIAVLVIILVILVILITFGPKKEVTKEKTQINKISLRESLLQSGFGIKLTEEILQKKGLSDTLKQKILDSKKKIDLQNKIILIIGCNGTGKTTATCNLAKYIKDNNKTIGVVGCDTFRPAAMQQLQNMCEKNLIETFIEGKNSSSVAYNGYLKFQDKDAIIFDTAGRNHKDENLKKELEKIYLNLTKNCKVTSFFIADLTVGSVLLEQYETFNSYLKLNGIILTKVDLITNPGIFYQLVDKFTPNIYGISYNGNIEPYEPETFINAPIFKS
jgi:fused signal recognition particle receptor